MGVIDEADTKGMSRALRQIRHDFHRERAINICTVIVVLADRKQWRTYWIMILPRWTPTQHCAAHPQAWAEVKFLWSWCHQPSVLCPSPLFCNNIEQAVSHTLFWKGRCRCKNKILHSRFSRRVKVFSKAAKAQRQKINSRASGLNWLTSLKKIKG